MSKARSVMLAMSREAYQNPYAHIEELEQDDQGEEEKLHRPMLQPLAQGTSTTLTSLLITRNRKWNLCPKLSLKV